ncbi:thiamine biosynthesis protein ThiI, putative [Trichomonas vaginalis G3]|uniref:Thiamine biosynthesis protein ThiI, putative n=1 Tax=Trichomonas vaginalis (strain ATCC PRA-98 / G3) TaxID=412133 RepID=A2DQV1_TRIV3|nr:tRNA sulfurtransferase family [Trichomonas vaginalis G3]EAY17218.1 thiamine biosynthesis protein ThiI, putative [Trichomonas vaginalis G3]KAI5486250.1 tRNA sulfurtransferase family [Trichomonas vaginalis G3]|eukprot:XP_001329441.1 thiamine biosynthesis protein ThiI [Trichomonas vaginalis G3]
MSEEAKERVTFVYHPAELSLKGKNRGNFEDQLTKNMKLQLKHSGITDVHIEKIHGRHFVSVPADKESVLEEMSPKFFGVANYGRCYTFPRAQEDEFKKHIVQHFRELNEKSKIESFRIETSRVDKRFPLKSMEFSKEIGGLIHEQVGIPVNLTKPATTAWIEVLNDKFVYFTARLPGAAGLPVQSSGRVACLLSGGFDSPVAVWYMMRRGCAVQLVHFHSAPYGEWRSSVSKIRKIVSVLHQWGGPPKFYAIPIGEQQRQIAVDAPDKLRITLYRRLMMRVAKKICERQHCEALATGDSLGQVASQTINSMTTIESVISPDMLIFRPLLGFNKEEIMEKAQQIGTYDISILPAGDCCSHMLPKKVATHPTIEEATEGEKKLNIDKMVEDAIAAAQLIDINAPWNEEEPGEALACPLTTSKFQE